MPLYFWFSNLHYVLEFLGALAFFGLAWLTFDTLRVRQDAKQMVKGLGFSLLAISQLIHGLDVRENTPLLFGMAAQLAGLAAVFVALFLEKPPTRPTFSAALIVLPAAASYIRGVDTVSFFVSLTIASLSWWRYKNERNRFLISLGLAFSFLSVSYLFGAIFDGEPIAVSVPWVLAHILRITAFVFLGRWLWQFLSTRMTEQLLLISILLAGLIGILVTFSFSPLLLSRLNQLTRAELSAAGKSVEAILTEKARIAKSELTLLAEDPAFVRAVSRGALRDTEEQARKRLDAVDMDFFTLALPNGAVLTRTHALVVRGDTMSGDPVFRQARQQGEGVFDIADVSPEGLSLRAAVPVFSAGVPVGIAMTGVRLDEVSGKNFSEIVGHEVVFFGAADAEGTVREVLERGDVFSGTVSFDGRPSLGYLFPIKDAAMKTVGVGVVRQPQVELSRTLAATNRITFLTTLATLLIILLPAQSALRRILMQR